MFRPPAVRRRHGPDDGQPQAAALSAGLVAVESFEDLPGGQCVRTVDLPMLEAEVQPGRQIVGAVISRIRQRRSRRQMLVARQKAGAGRQIVGDLQSPDFAHATTVPVLRAGVGGRSVAR